jgi:hypothetical protein
MQDHGAGLQTLEGLVQLWRVHSALRFSGPCFSAQHDQQSFPDGAFGLGTLPKDLKRVQPINQDTAKHDPVPEGLHLTHLNKEAENRLNMFCHSEGDLLQNP